jgi:hypothetical protein
MVRSQTLYFRGSLSFFSLFSLRHCQGNGLNSVFRKVAGKCWLRTQHCPPNRQASLQVSCRSRWQCLSAQCMLPPWLGTHTEWVGQATLSCNTLFPSYSLTLKYRPPISFGDNSGTVGDCTPRSQSPSDWGQLVMPQPFRLSFTAHPPSFSSSLLFFSHSFSLPWQAVLEGEFTAWAMGT